MGRYGRLSLTALAFLLTVTGPGELYAHGKYARDITDARNIKYTFMAAPGVRRPTWASSWT